MGKPIEELKIVSCHLGNGSSITAINGGKSVDTSMGFTPLDGLVMGTRCGSVDPSAVDYVEKKMGFTPDQMTEYMNKKSGFLGLSGIGSDNRDIQAAASEGNERALIVYTHTVAMIQNLVVPYLGKKQIQKVQTYDLEQFYATLSRTPRGLYKQGVKQTLTDKQKRQFLTGASIREVHAMLKTAFSYAVEWGLLLKSPIPREAPKSTSEERAIWDEKTMLAALQTMTDPTLHLAVHLSMILSLRVGEILGLQPGDIDFDAADGRGTITVGRSLQRTEKAALEKTDPNQIYHIFPDQREGSSSALVLKKPKTKKSSRTLYLTRPLKEELLAWLEKLRQDELAMDGRYRNCGQLFRLPNGMPVAPEALSKWYRTWRAEHPEFEKIVFHGLRHSSATYQLIESGGNIKAVQGNTGHATTGILMDTYAHTQDKPRLELAEKLEADFYSQDIGSPKSGSVPVKENLPDSIQITPEGMLKVVRQMNPEQRREFTRLLFA